MNVLGLAGNEMSSGGELRGLGKFCGWTVGRGPLSSWGSNDPWRRAPGHS